MANKRKQKLKTDEAWTDEDEDNSANEILDTDQR